MKIVSPILLFICKTTHVSSQRGGGAPLIGPPTLAVGQPMIRPIAQPLGEIFAQKRVQWLPTMSASPVVQEVPVTSHAMPIIVNDIHIRTIRREHTCPPGERLVGRQCQSVKTCPPEYLCPPSTIREANACVSITRPIVECPAGHSLDAEGSCKSCEVVPADFRCDEGFHLIGAGVNRHCHKIKEGSLTCPAGFVLNDNVCLKEVRAAAACPPDYKLIAADYSCVRDISFPASLSCAEGAFKEQNSCVLYRELPPRCPAGFQIENDSCISRVAKVLLPCAENQRKNGTFCDEVIERPAERICPFDDMTIDGNLCIKEIPPEILCSPGFALNAANKCERHTAPLFECNDVNKIFDRGECLKKKVVPPKTTCPPGFTLAHSSCVKIDRVPYSLQCPIGSILHRNICLIETETKDPSYVCPTGMRLHSAENEETGKKRTLCSIDSNDQQPSSVVTNIRPMWTPINSSEDHDIAEVPAAVPPTKLCLEGMYESGNSCLKLELVSPTRVCRPNYIPDGETCIRELNTPVKTECEPGTIREGKDCVAFVREPANVRCPPNTYPDTTNSAAFTCVEIREPELKTGTAVTAPVKWICCDGQPSEGPVCRTTVRHISSAVCPPGSVDEGHQSGDCIIRRSIEYPQPERMVAPHLATWVCPEHSYRSGQQCLASETIPAHRQCPEPTKMVGDKCYVEVEPIKTPDDCIQFRAEMFCPEGATLRGSSCIIHKKVDAKLTCPEGFKLDSDRCIQQHPLRPFCPHGTELRSGMCARDVFRPAFERLVEGCSHERQGDGVYASRCS